MADDEGSTEEPTAVGEYTPGQVFTDAAGLTYQPAESPAVPLLPAERDGDVG